MMRGKFAGFAGFAFWLWGLLRTGEEVDEFWKNNMASYSASASIRGTKAQQNPGVK